jgi:hypothetical protein
MRATWKDGADAGDSVMQADDETTLAVVTEPRKLRAVNDVDAG